MKEIKEVDGFSIEPTHEGIKDFSFRFLLDPDHPAVEVHYRSGKVEVIDVLTTLKVSPLFLNEPGMAEAVQVWQLIVQSRFNPHVPHDWVRVSRKHLKRVGTILCEVAENRPFTDENNLLVDERRVRELLQPLWNAWRTKFRHYRNRELRENEFEKFVRANIVNDQLLEPIVEAIRKSTTLQGAVNRYQACTPPRRSLQTIKDKKARARKSLRQTKDYMRRLHRLVKERFSQERDPD